MVPSVSLRAVLMSSSLVMCLWSAPSGIVGIVVFEVEEDRAEVWAAAAAATFDDSDGGSRGLHGEWDPADVLEDAASGTPDDG